MRYALPAFATMICVSFTSAGLAGDLYYKMPIRSLELVDGELPADPEPRWDRRETLAAMRPYVVLDQPGEAYVSQPPPAAADPWRPQVAFLRDSSMLISTSSEGDLTGTLYVARPSLDGMHALRFRIPASAADPDVRGQFLEAKEESYQALLTREIAGSAWFRHQIREARLARPGAAADVAAPPPPRDWRRRRSDLSDTYALFSGGRALSENLQLDRVLPPAAADQPAVQLDSIDGIIMRELDWAELLGDATPALDALAPVIPADQHVIFLPSFEAGMKVIDEAELHGVPVVHLLEPRAESARVIERYERQLCLPRSALSRLLGPQVVRSIALTGSDPYYRTGTDVAVIVESQDAAALRAVLATQVQVLSRTAGARLGDTEIEGLTCTSAITPDRSICCYLARIGDAVVVTNSPAQLARLVQVRAGQSRSIADLPEYRYFRSRYALGEGDESAFIFLSDATIRRWCGPQWRIATSRRTRDAAVMAELQATHFQGLARGEVEPGPLHTDLPTAQIGSLRLTPQGVASSVYNTLAFLTPIAEIQITEVTTAEAEAYAQWRDGYQRNWRQYFDPIGVRIAVSDDRLAADVTVMPLILGTEYEMLAATSRGVELEPLAGDVHDALFHAAMSLNHESLPMRQAGGMVGMVAPNIADPLGWLGDWISLYADDDPFWHDLAQTPPEQEDDFWEANQYRLPLALHVAVKDQLKLAAFLTSLRAFAVQTAPGMAVWQAKEHEGRAYVQITPTDEAVAEGMAPKGASICYAIAGDGLVVTLSEALLKRALERKASRQAGGENHGGQDVLPWLGGSLGLKVAERGFELIARLTDRFWRHRLQVRSWGNIPILNEWKRRFPDQDPLSLHEKFWHTRLVCPGGGQYVWNQRDQTMESTAFGSPVSPRDGPESLHVLQSITRGDFGLTFESDGLTARTVLLKQQPATP